MMAWLIARETRVLGAIGGLGVGWSVRQRGLPCRAWRACGGQTDGRHRKVQAACRASAEPGFQGRGAAQAIGDAGEDDRDVGGAEGSGEEGEASGGGVLAADVKEYFPPPSVR
jgi:hypothetical protein